MKSYRVFFLLVIFLAPLLCAGAGTDTFSVVKEIVTVLKSVEKTAYDYTMDVTFPNGDKDHLEGNIFIDAHEKKYHVDCNAFEMLYTSNWLYKADHRSRKVTIVNLSGKEHDKMRAATERGIFKNDAIPVFLDSIILKNAKIRKQSFEGSLLKLELSFPEKGVVQRVEFLYDTSSKTVVKMLMTVRHLYEKTTKGPKFIETQISCRNFKCNAENNTLSEQPYFEVKGTKIVLNKFKDYRLISHM